MALLCFPLQSFATSLHLFTQTPATDSGPGTGPSQAVAFASYQIVLRCDNPVSAVLASTADGTGQLVVDNFMTVNDTNICTGGIYSQDSENCYSEYSQYRGYSGVNPIDISDKIPAGKGFFEISLMDFGGFLGNSDIWLVTNCAVDEKVELCHKPRTAAQKTISVFQSAVPGHLGHGDYLGPCKQKKHRNR